MPLWMVFATFVGTGLLLVPIVYTAWFEGYVAARRRRTEELVAKAVRDEHDAKGEPPLH